MVNIDNHYQNVKPNAASTIKYTCLLKTGSLDNAIREFSLAKPSWYMSHYTMIYKKGERMRDFLGLFVVYCSLVFYILGAFLIKQYSIFHERAFHSLLLDMR